MNETTQDQFKNELNPGETIEWCGEPYKGFYIRSDEIIVFPLYAIWGFLIFSFFSFLIPTEEFGIYRIIIGFVIVLCSFFAEPIFHFFLRFKTSYAITNHRIIIRSGIINLNTKSIFLAELNELYLSIHKSGKGTIRFGGSQTVPVWNYKYKFNVVDRTYDTPSFELIDNVKEIYGLIKKLQFEKTNKK